MSVMAPEDEELTVAPQTDRAPMVAVALIVLGLGAWIISIFTINIKHVNGLGFAGAFTPLTWLSLLLVSSALVVTVYTVDSTGKWFWRLAVTGILLLIAVIHATPMILESAPRFFEAYTHAGFIDYIYRTGQHSVHVNNRLSWFGAFGLGATLSGTAGEPSLLGAIRLTPWVFAMVILLPIHSIVSHFFADARVRAAALCIFVVGNWIAQDYFSPQALTYFITMSLIAMILAFAPQDGPSIRQFRTWWDGRRSPPAIAIVVAILSIGVVLAHQLSPLMLFALVLVLVIMGSTSFRILPVAIFAAIATWLSVGGFFFWGGHIGVLLGVHQQSGQSLGFGSIIAQNLTNRLHRNGLDLVVAGSRVGLSLILITLAGISFLVARRERPVQVLGFLALIPFLFLATTGYGGEALLRALFFALPFIAALIAYLALKVRARPLSLVALILAFTLLGAMTEVARYGNEKFEQISADQLAIMQDLYRTMPPNTDLLAFGRAMPAYFTNIDKFKTFYMTFYKFDKGGASSPRAEKEIIDQINRQKPGVVVWTPQAAEFNSHTFHFTEGWDKPVLKHLLAERGARLIVNRPDIKIISFDPAWHPSASAFSTNGT